MRMSPGKFSASSPNFLPSWSSPLQATHEDGTCFSLQAETWWKHQTPSRTNAARVALQIKESKAILLSSDKPMRNMSLALTRLTNSTLSASRIRTPIENCSNTSWSKDWQTSSWKKAVFERRIQDLLQKMKIVEVLASLRKPRQRIGEGYTKTLSFPSRDVWTIKKLDTYRRLMLFKTETLYFPKKMISRWKNGFGLLDLFRLIQKITRLA